MFPGHKRNPNLPFSNFTDAYPDKPFTNIPGPSNENLHNCVYYVSIDSRDRDRTINPNPNEYKIHFSGGDGVKGANVNRRFKNVLGLELLSATLPNVNDISDEIYVLLELDGLETDVHDATNTEVCNAFSKMQFTPTSSKFVRLDTDLSMPLHVEFYQEIASLKNFTIKLKKNDGSLFDFGIDTLPPLDPNPDLQNSFTFKVVTREPKLNKLDRRNV